VLRNAIKEYWEKNNLPIGSFIRCSGEQITYEANETEVLDEAAIFKRYKDGEMTEEQFLGLIKISITDARKVLGADVVAKHTVKKVGAKLDVRFDDLPVESANDEFIFVNEVVKEQKKRRVFGATKPSVETTKPTMRRKIIIRK
jgi:hypothetical protein